MLLLLILTLLFLCFLYAILFSSYSYFQYLFPNLLYISLFKIFYIKIIGDD